MKDENKQHDKVVGDTLAIKEGGKMIVGKIVRIYGNHGTVKWNDGKTTVEDLREFT